MRTNKYRNEDDRPPANSGVKRKSVDVEDGQDNKESRPSNNKMAIKRRKSVHDGHVDNPKRRAEYVRDVVPTQLKSVRNFDNVANEHQQKAAAPAPPPIIKDNKQKQLPRSNKPVVDQQQQQQTKKTNHHRQQLADDDGERPTKNKRRQTKTEYNSSDPSPNHKESIDSSGPAAAVDMPREPRKRTVSERISPDPGTLSMIASEDEAIEEHAYRQLSRSP